MAQSHALKGMVRTLRWLSPGLESAIRRFYFSRQFRVVSHKQLTKVSEDLASSWMDDAIPEQQRAVVDRQIELYRAGKPIQVFDALIGTLVDNVEGLDSKTLLEIGCSSGYYCEVLSCRGVSVSYRGCDVSPAFIGLARRLYPSVPFDVEDATRLSYHSASFDIVVSGCCLLHIYDYEKAISEAARVSKEFVVFHRTPVLHMSGPTFYQKRAYGVEMLEIHFNEQQLLRMFTAHNLQVMDINSRLSSPVSTDNDVLIYKTYLCRKTL